MRQLGRKGIAMSESWNFTTHQHSAGFSIVPHDDGPRICIVPYTKADTKHFPQIDNSESRRLAKLFAASPQMLEALQAVADLKGWNKTPPTCATGIQVVAAIARATP